MLSITCDSSELAEGLKLIFDIQGLADVMLHNTIYFLIDKGNRSVPGVPDWAAWIAFLKMGTMSATLLTNHFFFSIFEKCHYDSDMWTLPVVFLHRFQCFIINV